MVWRQFFQSPMNGSGVIFCERWLFGFFERFRVYILRPFSRCIAADAIHRNAMCNAIEPKFDYR